MPPSPPPGPKVRPARYAALALALGAVLGWHCILNRPSAVIRAPSGMAQLDIFSSPDGTVFYLQHAGFRLRHEWRLLARARAGQGWNAVWTGPDSAEIRLAPQVRG